MSSSTAAPFFVSSGEPLPLGATLRPEGVNFSLFSRNATAVELLLFAGPHDDAPQQVVLLSPQNHRTFHYWHALVHGAAEGQLYAFRVHGPWDPAQGHRFNARKVLLDPYARGIVYQDGRAHGGACGDDDNIDTAMKSLVVDPTHYDWEDVVPPRIDPSERVIYELHVRGFTRDPSSGVGQPGTFAGIVEKIPYLLDLGVTTVELLPVFQFDEHEVPRVDPTTGVPLRNFWGYDPIGFFAPHRGYYVEGWERMAYLTGFRDMVKALHRAGLEVFLDVVFNHTAEGDERGPTFSFRGIENSAYYLLEGEDRSRYADFSGTGNTVSCNHPLVRKMILDCLRYWVDVMHVDGFRFDLAAVMSRDEQGRPLADPPLPWEIEMDPTLARTRLVAEAWDAVGLYQVGHFPGERWFEWNGMFRDDVRRFVRGDFGFAGAIATRMMGSPDLYERRGRPSSQSINFVTCHDGFTLWDLVSFAHKHNEANGEDDRDGSDHEYSANLGFEGETDDSAVVARRLRQIKNFMAVLILSQGTPMLLGGDEICRTQGGNNNAYCQDNATSWVDWTRRERFAEIHRFVRECLRLRRMHPSLRRLRYLMGHDAPADASPPGATRVRWHGTRLDTPDWSEGSRAVAFTLLRSHDDTALHVILNMHDQPLSFALPPPAPGFAWRRALDTAQTPPHDAAAHGEGPRIDSALRVRERSVVLLVERSTASIERPA